MTRAARSSDRRGKHPVSTRRLDFERLEQRAVLSATIGMEPLAGLALARGPRVVVTAEAAVTTFGLMMPANAPNGMPVPIAIVALGTNGRPVRSFSGTANLATSDTAATIPATVTFRQGAAVLKATFVTPGQQSVTVSHAATPTITGTATTTVAAPQVLTRFNVALAPSVRADKPSRAIVLALDAAGRPMRSFDGPVKLASSDTAAVLPEGVSFRGGRAEIAVTFKTVGSQALTVSGGADGGISASATTTVVAAPVATQFAVIMPRTVRAGLPVFATLVALDAGGRPVDDYAGGVKLTSSDPAAVLPATVSWRHGRAFVRVTFMTPGGQSLTAAGELDGTLVGTASATVLSASKRPR